MHQWNVRIIGSERRRDQRAREPDGLPVGKPFEPGHSSDPNGQGFDTPIAARQGNTRKRRRTPRMSLKQSLFKAAAFRTFK